MVQFQFLMVFGSIRRVFRDHCAKWISGFTMQTGDESVFKIEVKTILEGLKITRGSEFQQVEVECDNNLVVECAANSKM
ncbi:hypothetical protein Gotri_000262 [Gossypium trilobum]|uniref:RNase H type-1 domain-containing protein n=1 Tax=Gossypium trilobum TaxID=34281 RepID=A0A7J9FAQ3_9ROSI|nr:hypothetical protein [Gossypium trilobum]